MIPGPCTAGGTPTPQVSRILKTGLSIGIAGIFIRFVVGFVAAFCWSIVSGLAGISSPGSSAKPAYGIGIVICFIFGLRCGGILAKKWFPIKEAGEGITKDDEAAMKATYRKLTGRNQ